MGYCLISGSIRTFHSLANTVISGMPHTNSAGNISRKIRRPALILATAIALAPALAYLPSALAADGDDKSYSSNRLWASQMQDYATKSLNSDEALSMAAVPLNGPGLDQHINADIPMSPGSIMKVITTYAALEILGPTHHWDTDFLTDGQMVDYTLAGNLYVRFGGDPKLTFERLWTALRELRDMGINRIDGNLILDGSYFKIDGGFPAFIDNGDNPHAPFLVEPSAYLTNLNLIHFQIRADERGTQAWITPALGEVVIDNRVTAVAEGPCPSRRSFDWEPMAQAGGKVTVRVTGELPQGCRTTTYLSLLPHEQYSASMIRSLFSEMGIIVTGGSQTGLTPETARLVMKTTSPDLVTMVRDINKWSSNVMARQLLRSEERRVGKECRYRWARDE